MAKASATTQHQQVFQLCYEIAETKLREGQAKEARAVLRALRVYLDTFPAFPDRSCVHRAEHLFDEVNAVIFAKEEEKMS